MRQIRIGSKSITQAVNKAERERREQLRQQPRKIKLVKGNKHETAHNTPTTQPQ